MNAKAKELNASPDSTTINSLLDVNAAAPPYFKGNANDKPRIENVNCPNPKPNTSFFIFFNRSTLSSNPISNKKNTIPNSANISVVCKLHPDINDNPLGPSNIPDNKNPNVGDVLYFLHVGGTNAVNNNNNNVSNLMPIVYWMQ